MPPLVYSQMEGLCTQEPEAVVDTFVPDNPMADEPASQSGEKGRIQETEDSCPESGDEGKIPKLAVASPSESLDLTPHDSALQDMSHDLASGDEGKVPKLVFASPSKSLDLTPHDGALQTASHDLASYLGQVDVTGTLQKADQLFVSIMDPTNAETRMLIEELFTSPMKAIVGKAVKAIENIDVDNAEMASKQVQIIADILDVSVKVRETCLDHVYQNMERQIDHFSTSVDVYNEKMKATVMQALEMYTERIEVEINVRSRVLQQKKEESMAMLDLWNHQQAAEVQNMVAHEDARLATSRKKLDHSKEKAEHQHQKELKALERAERKAQQDLDKQRKKNDQALEMNRAKAEAEIQRISKKNQAAHEKNMKDLEVKEKQGKLDKAGRSEIMEELKVEMTRYQSEFKLAEFAMKEAIAKGGSCTMNHTAPKIEWSDPPRVVPGSVSWRSRG